MSMTQKKQASPKADKLQQLREQSLANSKSGHYQGKRKADNKAKIVELKGNKKNQIK